MKTRQEIYRAAGLAAFDISTRLHNQFMATYFAGETSIPADSLELSRRRRVAERLGSRLLKQSREDEQTQLT